MALNNVWDQILDVDKVLNSTLSEVLNRISDKWAGTGCWIMHWIGYGLGWWIGMEY